MRAGKIRGKKQYSGYAVVDVNVKMSQNALLQIGAIPACKPTEP